MINTINDFVFRPMVRADLDTESNIKIIASLIYDTDPYIYPAFFDSKENAIALIPELIKSEDTMFCYQNIFIAEENKQVVGIILWHRGPLHWNSKALLSCLKLKGMSVPQNVARVKDEYFSSYADVPDSTISIINVCVCKEKRNKGIATQMLKAFIHKTENECELYELFVLTDNLSAIKVYKNLGFCVERQLQGFMIEPGELPCYQMIRSNNGNNLK